MDMVNMFIPCFCENHAFLCEREILYFTQNTCQYKNSNSLLKVQHIPINHREWIEKFKQNSLIYKNKVFVKIPFFFRILNPSFTLEY